MDQPLAKFYLCVAQWTPEAIRNMGSKPCYPCFDQQACHIHPLPITHMLSHIVVSGGQ